LLLDIHPTYTHAREFTISWRNAGVLDIHESRWMSTIEPKAVNTNTGRRKWLFGLFINY
jgi:hypothetical protein